MSKHALKLSGKTIILALDPIGPIERVALGDSGYAFTGGEIVEVLVSTNPDGNEMLLVTIDGVCRLRVCCPGQIILNDKRRIPGPVKDPTICEHGQNFITCSVCEGHPPAK